MPAERLRRVAHDVAFDVVVDHACATVGCDHPGLADRVAERLPPGSATRIVGEPVGAVTVTCRGTTIDVTDTDGNGRSFDDTPAALHVVDGAIRRIVAVHAPDLVFIHAGVVALHGRAIVFPGRSMTGKTTLVAALIEAGATYLSDEYAPVDADGLVHPYPRRLSMRTGTGRREVAATDLGGPAADRPFPVGLVAAVAHEPGGVFTVTDGTQAACAEALIDNAVAARVRPTEVLGVAARLARTVRFVTGARGEAREAVAGVRALVEAGGR